MSKKILMVIVTVIMIFTLKGTAYAAELTGDGDSVNVPVRYTVNNTAFVITVPMVITADTKDCYFEISASKMNLRPDEAVVVSIVSGCDIDGAVNLVRQDVATDKPVATLKTMLTVGGKSIVENDYRVGYFRDSINSEINLDGKVTLSGLEINENTEAGDYEGIIRFQVELRPDET